MSFDERVWQLLKKIPKSKVTTYKILAEKLNSKAYRAVGNACHRNPFYPEVPCHRVVYSDGRIGGFRKGIKEKIKRLEQEGVEVKNNRIVNFQNVLFRF